MAQSTLKRIPQITWQGRTTSDLDALIASMNTYDCVMAQIAGDLATFLTATNSIVVGVIVKSGAALADMMFSAYGSAYIYQARYNPSTGELVGRRRVQMTAF